MLVFFIYLTNICKLKFLAWSQQQILVVQITSVINYKASAWKGLFCQNLAKILKDLTEKDFSVHILFKSIVAQGLLWCNCRDFKKLIKKYQKFFVTAEWWNPRMRDWLSIFCAHVCSQKQEQRCQYSFMLTWTDYLHFNHRSQMLSRWSLWMMLMIIVMTLISPFEHVPLDALKGCRIAHHKFIAALITHFSSQSANFQDWAT